MFHQSAFRAKTALCRCIKLLGDSIGLPGFQFIQDPIEYFGRTWHTTQDVVDRVIEEYLKRSAVIMATFAYNSAMRDKQIPRKGI